MDKMTHTKFNLNNFLIALGSSLDNTIPKNKYNIEHNSKRIAYIALRIATLRKVSKEELSDIFSYSTIYNIGLSRDEILSFPFLDKNILENKIINDIVSIASTIEKNLNIQNNIIINKDEIISLFPDDTNLNNLFKEISFWYDLTASYQLPFFIFNHLQDFTLELEFSKLIYLSKTINKIIYNYSNRIYKESIDIKCKKISKLYGLDNKDESRLIVASLLINIGLLHIPYSLLENKNSLEKNEFEIFQSVPYHTNSVLNQVFGFDDIAKFCSYSYERLDGSGYPYNIMGNNLSLKDRILSILTIYQALEENRPYRNSHNKSEISNILIKMANDGKIDTAISNDLIEIL